MYSRFLRCPWERQINQLGEAHSDALIVDPYMDDKALTVFALLAKEQVAIRLLSDAGHVKPSLKPAAQAWTAQYGAARPSEARSRAHAT
jgi:hypothetical protein